MMSTTLFAAPEALNGHKMDAKTYLERERAGIREFEGKYELFNQTLIFRTGASEAHNDIAANIVGIFKMLIWQNDDPYRVFQSDMKVVSFLDYKDYFYPDGVFISEKTRYDSKQKDVLINPNILFEVLSDGTEDFDRTDKFESYKQIESLKEYILVSQYERRVEHFYKDETGEWITGKVYTSGELPLKSITYKLPLKRIYYGMAF